jgi:hypothetical protein
MTKKKVIDQEGAEVEEIAVEEANLETGDKIDDPQLEYAIQREVEEIAKNTGKTYQELYDAAKEITGINDQP